MPHALMTERSHATIVEVAQHSAAASPSDVAYAYLGDGEAVSGELTRQALDARARAIATELARCGATGRAVLILCPAGLEYVASLFGCFYGRAIAVPAYPPTRTGLARTMPRIRAICEDCRPVAVLTTVAVREVLRGDAALRGLVEAIPLVAVDELRGEVDAALPEVTAADLALLQYTSGSTATPKGVLVTHGQLVANAALIEASSELSREDRVLSWLPPYHDMGLVGGILQPAFAGCLAILMPPDAFLRRPQRWLKAATTWRATVLLAPNFALDACVRRVDDEQRALLDLDPVRLVCIGAEPIRSETLERFVSAFAGCGFKREALFPCYGMAEATLMISAGSAHEPPIVHEYSAEQLELGEATHETAGVPAHKIRALVSCGRAIGEERVLIVDPASCEELPDGRIGEVWVQSPAVASGYFERPEETAATFHAYAELRGTRERVGPLLRTGDLGFLERGELFITGRLKDLIIVRGRNHAPQDIERTVQALDEALVMDGGAAFSIELEGAEQLVVVQELDKRTGKDPSALLAAIPEAIREAHDITPAAVVLIKRGSLGKTSSGKVQRRATRAAYIGGTLEVVESWHAPGAAATSSTPTVPAPSMRSERATLERITTRPTAAASPRALEIEKWLRERIAQKLGIAAEEIDPRDTLARYGVDSALAAELIDELERWLNLRLDTTISYDHPTIVSLSRALASMASRGASGAPATVSSLRPTVPVPAGGRGVEPIAIVGMSCRFPGAPSLDAFWELLLEGKDAITEVPRERWDAEALYAKEPGTPGKMCSKWGGFIDEIDRFDAAFFGISPHEAARMDPQQRLFLEVAWEALEDAGIAPTKLAGTRTGVFAGVCTSDFAMLYGGELRLVDGDYGTGSAPSIVANRLSYLLDLKGPSETVDSACSSALVALYHASQALAHDDCDTAVVGGVNAVLAPEVSVSFSQIGALARDGRCKAFDVRADGFVRSEGAGVIVLKRLSAAQQAGDRIYALVAGSAVNHDGRSNGLSAPSGPAQRDVIERALQRAGITAGELDYVEAHGVGTQVADAVELHALTGLLERVPRSEPLLVGSAKTNVGHLEAASGMVSVIKVALALAHEQLPGQLHCEQPIAALAAGPLRLAREHTPWRRGLRPRLAGASCFGFGGSNAHVVLREGLAATSAAEPSSSPQLITLSARTGGALAASVRKLADHLERRPDAHLADVAFTLNTGRAQLGERLALVCSGLDELRDALLSVSVGGAPRGAIRGSVRPSAHPRFGLLVTETALHPDAVLELRAAFPRIAPLLDQDERLLRELLAVPLREALWQGTSERRAELLVRPSIGYAALAVAQHALSRVLEDFGLEPALVFGSGAGEHAAAAIAGCIPWHQAIVHAARRGAVHEGLTPGATQRVTLRDAKRALEGLERTLRPARVPLISAQLDRALGADERLDTAFWSKHLLADAAPAAPGARAALREAACDVLLDLTAREEQAEAVPLLPEGGVARGVLRALGALFARGVPFDLERLYADRPHRKLALPTYPFERERHWLDFPDRDRGAKRASTLTPGSERLIERTTSHPFAGRLRTSRPATAGSPPPSTSDTVAGSGFVRRTDEEPPAKKKS